MVATLNADRRSCGRQQSMQSYDIFMLVVLATTTIWGLWKGLAWQLASLGSIFLSYFVAHQFRYKVAEWIHTEPPWNVLLAMLILYLATSALVWIAFGTLRAFISRVKLKEFDHQVGAILGAAKGVVLCVIITLFAVTLAPESQRKSIIASRSGFYIACLLDKSHVIMPDELHQVLEPYLHRLDDSQEETSREHGDEEFHSRESSRRPSHWILRATTTNARGPVL